jgi:hypothetical protein
MKTQPKSSGWAKMLALHHKTEFGDYKERIATRREFCSAVALPDLVVSHVVKTKNTHGTGRSSGLAFFSVAGAHCTFFVHLTKDEDGIDASMQDRGIWAQTNEKALQALTSRYAFTDPAEAKNTLCAAINERLSKATIPF